MKRVKKQDADIDLEMDDYEPSGSDDDYDANEKLMLKEAAKRRSKQYNNDEESEEEVFGIHESDESDEEDKDEPEPLGDEMDSDIEGKDGDYDNLPDSKAWGTRKNSYYNTDYVDQDYGGFSKAEEEEAALLEEEEARTIQTRLLAELEDADFSLGTTTSKTPKETKDASLEDNDFGEVIKTDVSKLGKREKLALLEKESPEFMGLVSDFKERLSYAKEFLEPILNLVESGEIPDCPAAKFVFTKYHIILNYCTNIAFYLLLKSKRVRVQNHPVVKRLVQYCKLLEEMDPIDLNIIHPQVMEIIKLKEKGKELEVVRPKMPTPQDVSGNRVERRRKLQELWEEQHEVAVKKTKVVSFEEMQLHPDVDEDIVEPEEINNDAEKRGISFEIAKNKGLTPKRKKENRNPRVKYRNKFDKATIRRKGQVRGIYKQTTRYDGEPFGIKASVSKSIKFK